MNKLAISIVIAGIEPKPATENPSRISAVVWGDAGTGKTTLGSTLPGKVAHLCFDPDGASSISDSKHVDVYNLGNVGVSITNQFFVSDPLKITELCKEYDSILVDSLTAIQDLCLERGIRETKGATILRPSPGAYGARNNIIMKLVSTLVQVTGEHNKHILFTAHESDPTTNEQGVILPITLSLGGKLPKHIPAKINEVWHMYTNSRGERFIMVQPARNKTPIKTRMFKTTSNIEAKWKYDPDSLDNVRTIEHWYNMWKENGFRKIDFGEANK